MKQIIILSFVICNLLFVKNVSAAPSNQGLGCGGGLGPFAEALCNLTSSDTEVVGKQTNLLMSGIIGFLTMVAGLWFGIQMILGGYDWINSAGDKGKLETARNKILYAIIGFGVVVASFIIIGLIGTLMGVQILNPGEILSNIK